MGAVIVAVIFISTAAIASAAAGIWRRSKPDEFLSLVQSRKVVVTLKSGETVQGFWGTEYREFVALEHPYVLGAGPKGEALKVDGPLLAPKAEIAYVQIP